MAAKRYGQEQIAEILDAISAGAKIAEMCRKYNVSRTTVHRWQKRLRSTAGERPERESRLTGQPAVNGLGTRAACLRELQAENTRLKRIVVRQALDIDALQELMARQRNC